MKDYKNLLDKPLSLEARAAIARSRMGEKYLCHPANEVKRIPKNRQEKAPLLTRYAQTGKLQ